MEIQTKMTESRYILRFRDSQMREKLKQSGRDNGRTLNAELLFLIQKGVEAVYGKSH